MGEGGGVVRGAGGGEVVEGAGAGRVEGLEVRVLTVENNFLV